MDPRNLPPFQGYPAGLPYTQTAPTDGQNQSFTNMAPNMGFDDPYSFSPGPKPQPYTFMRRIHKMNWDFLDKVDVGAIVRNGDVESVEYLLGSIAFANLTNEDFKHFGTRAGLNSFLLLQLAVEVLVNKINTNNNVPPTPQPPSTPSFDGGFRTEALYEARIDLMNKDIRARDLIIQNLTDKLQIAERQRDEALIKLQSLQKQEIPDQSGEKSDSDLLFSDEGPNGTLIEGSKLKNYAESMNNESARHNERKSRHIKRKSRRKEVSTTHAHQPQYLHPPTRPAW